MSGVACRAPWHSFPASSSFSSVQFNSLQTVWCTASRLANLEPSKLVHLLPSIHFSSGPILRDPQRVWSRSNSYLGGLSIASDLVHTRQHSITPSLQSEPRFSLVFSPLAPKPGTLHAPVVCSSLVKLVVFGAQRPTLN